MATERPIKSLSELMDGGVEERFNQELDKVWQNVYDPNTDSKQCPNANPQGKDRSQRARDSCDFRVNVTSSLAPYADLTQTVMLSVGADGEIRATERTDQVPGQISMDGDETPMPKTIEFGKIRESK